MSDDDARERALDHLCRDQEWSQEVRACLRDASDASRGACIARLDAQQMARVDEVMTRAVVIDSVESSRWYVERKLPGECGDLKRARDAAKTCRTISQQERDELDDWWRELASYLRPKWEGEGPSMAATALPQLCDAYSFKARKKLEAARCAY